MAERVIQQGAEAVLIKKEVDARIPRLRSLNHELAPLANCRDSSIVLAARSAHRAQDSSAPQAIILKRRVAKGYRLKELDEKIRKLRTRSEVKLLEKAGKTIYVPRVLKVNEKDKEIDMEFISGLKLSENLDKMKNWEEVCLAIGENIALLHDAGIIHGDLTTSNMIWSDGKGARPPAQSQVGKLIKNARDGKNSKKGRLYFIDFGLGFANGTIEDKAVDLYLIKEALEAKHFLHFEKFFKEVLEGYKESKNCKEVLKRLEKVEKRGRYKNQY